MLDLPPRRYVVHCPTWPSSDTWRVTVRQFELRGFLFLQCGTDLSTQRCFEQGVYSHLRAQAKLRIIKNQCFDY
jgi:hypothetical protein